MCVCVCVCVCEVGSSLLQVVLDPSLTRTQSREVCEMRRELEKAGTCKAVDRHSALLPLFEKTGRLKLPAVRYILTQLFYSESIQNMIVYNNTYSYVLL